VSPSRRPAALRSRLLLALLLSLVAGPTPGAVGSCGGDPLAKPADLERYCTQRDQLVCVRRSLRKELTAQETNDCRRAAIAQCGDRYWLPECQPSEREARACLNALESLDTLQTPESELSECSISALCKLSTPPPSPASEVAGGDGAGGGPAP
jgi:hypothetical protein